VPGGRAEGSLDVDSDLLRLIESIGVGPTAAAERAYPPAAATRLTAPAGSSQLPVGGMGGGSAGTSAGSAGGPLLAGVAAVVLIAAGGWFVVLLLRESYWNTVFIALPERPG
jgi:hypothetical protein